MSVLSMSCTD
ncbi:hypothetical protein SBY92_005044 [Candida maltosa Xu316]